MNRFLSIAEETTASFNELLKRAAALKTAVKVGKVERILDANESRTSPKVLALVFEKASTRTRVSFEMAMHHLGGKGLYLSPQEIGLGKREAVKDVAVVLGRYVDGIMARVFRHDDIVTLAENADVPVINGLSDLEHPCQALGDLETIVENGGGAGSKVAFIGDGNNVCHSLMLACALCYMPFVWVGPKGFEPDAEMMEKANGFGGKIELSHSIDGLQGADFVYTDVWASMGQEDETADRQKKFEAFQLNDDAIKRCPTAKILHCLPAHRGAEITDSVIDSSNSVVFDQAENRLYAQMAVIERLLG
ncbi:MAG: ornithine carbamoyltransferase [Candidatus Lindowbacteria bacterium]|nr:ornithine carbamoyltransferase [Candidatus Lindowbacteria bacterium]